MNCSNASGVLPCQPKLLSAQGMTEYSCECSCVRTFNEPFQLLLDGQAVPAASVDASAQPPSLNQLNSASVTQPGSTGQISGADCNRVASRRYSKHAASERSDAHV